MTRYGPGPCGRTGMAVLAVAAIAAMSGSLSAFAPDRPVPPASAAPGEAQDVYATARELARGGNRPEAIRLLQQRLATNPGDLDCRTLLGNVLLWDGRYADARAELNRVLAVEPDYVDALGALAYLELWTGHWLQAEILTARVLERTPNDTSILLARARALENLARPREAVVVLDRLLAIDPSTDAARQMRARIQDSLRRWKASYEYTYDWFDTGRDPWQEHELALGRRNRWGTATVKAVQADRYDIRDQQIELDLYPSLRPGTYFYINAGYSPDHTLYPEYRWGLDWYQRLGKGFEASIGYHYLDFGDGVDIYIGSLSKYLGNWLLTGQAFYVPDALGDSTSYHGQVRRYFGDSEYVALRYSYGVSWEEARDVTDVLLLNSEGVSGEFVKRLGQRTEVTVRGSWQRQERPVGGTISHSSAGAMLGFRF